MLIIKMQRLHGNRLLWQWIYLIIKYMWIINEFTKEKAKVGAHSSRNI